MSSVVALLTLTPAKNTTPIEVLMGKPMEVLRVTTLDIPVATLRLLEQVFSHTNRPNINEYLEYFLHTFVLALATLLAYFGLCLGHRIEAVEELRVLFGNLDICYNLSSF